jgi:heat shock protein HslJ
MKKSVFVAAFLAILVAVAAAPVSAAAPAQGPGDYIVEAGDWLSAIAAAQYGDMNLYPGIVLGTLEKAADDSGYANIVDPWVIEVGWKLYVPDKSTAESGITVTRLKDTTYQSDWTGDKSAPLTGGAYVEEMVPGAASKIEVRLGNRMGFGFTADGKPLAAVILTTNSGGSGTFVDLAVVVDEDGALVNRAVAALGDRTRIDSLGVAGGKVIVEMVTHGPDDPMCCPTQVVRNVYSFSGDTLVEESSQVIGDVIDDSAQASEPQLQDTVWQWEAYRDQAGLNDIAVAEPARYTLQFLSDGSYQIKADCNTGQGSYALEGSTLKLEPGPMTMAACAPDSRDADFVGLLADVASYLIADGKLYLNLAVDAGDMIFAAAP